MADIITFDEALDESQDYIEIKFNYSNHRIPVSVLTEYLSNLDSIIKDLSSVQGTTAELIIEAPQAGSVTIKGILQAIAHSDAGQALNYITNTEQKRWILGALGTICVFFITTCSWNKAQTIRQDSGDSYIFINGNNNPITINKQIFHTITSNESIPKKIAKMNRSVQNEQDLPSVDISLHDSSGKLLEKVSITNADAKTLATFDMETLELHQDKYTHHTRQSIKLTKVDFQGKSAWKMIFNDRPTAVYFDPEALDTVKQESINDKDTFIVDITVLQKYDEKLAIYVDYKYTITHMHQHIPYQSSPNLPFNE